MFPKKPDQRQLAKLAGVSLTTVSMALRNYPNISRETCLKVQRIAKEIGYSLDAQVSRHMAYLRSKPKQRDLQKLLILNYFPFTGLLTMKREHDLFWGNARQRAHELGYELEELWCHDVKMTSARVRSILVSRQVSGVVLTGAFGKPTHLRLNLDGISVVSCGNVFWRPEFHTVQSDHAHNHMLALREVVRRGYQQIGLVLAMGTAIQTLHQAEASYRYFQKLNPSLAKIPPFITRGPEPEGFSIWIKRYRPEVIIGHASVFTWLKSLGMKVPGEIGFACIGTSEIYSFAGVNSVPEQQARATIELLVDQINRGETGIPKYPKFVMLRGKWKNGPTLKTFK